MRFVLAEVPRLLTKFAQILDLDLKAKILMSAKLYPICVKMVNVLILWVRPFFKSIPQLIIVLTKETLTILGSYRCICNRGYKPDVSTLSTKCVDVNECLQRPGPCEHECTNSWGSYACSCPQVSPNSYLFKSFQEMPNVSIIWK